LKNWIIKKVLDLKGPGFCLEKWGTSTLHLSTGQEHGCHHCPPIKIDPAELIEPAALFNHSHKRQVRLEMLTGGKPKECSYCHESKGLQDRIIQSGHSYNWFNSYTNDVYSNPKSLEISFSNVCNLACSYCGPNFSSKWQSEITTKGNYPNGYNKLYITPILEKNYNPYIEAFWNYWPTIKQELKTLRITGGEPLLSKHTFKMLNEAGNIPVTINTNLSVDDIVIDELISVIRKKKNIMVATSGESQGVKAEYSRHGLDYNKWLKNLNRLNEECPNVKLHIMSTYNVFAVSSFTSFLKDVRSIDRRISLHITRLTEPDFLTHRLINDYKQESLDFISNNFKKSTFEKFKNIILDDEPTDDNIKRKFFEFITEYDQRRGLSFVKTFPEYKFLIR